MICYPLLTIVIPTYNEAKNIVPLLTGIRSALGTKFLYEMLFVDDSTDSTARIVECEMLSDCRIRLIHRKKDERSGLATAVLEGFRQANGTYVCCLDSDLQHPPEKIPEMLADIIESGSDITVASRYTTGGSATGLGSIYRRAVSIALKYLVYVLLKKARNSSDPGSGFFIFKKDIIREHYNLRPRGYKILLELLVRTDYKKVSEVPYAFQARQYELSKATLKQGVEFLKHVWLLWRTRPSVMFIGRVAVLILLLALMAVPALAANSLHDFLTIFIPIFSVAVTLQGIFSLFLMLYAWEDPERAEGDKSPRVYSKPQYSITAIIPARHEENVIQQTLRAVAAIDYPEHLKEIIVVCRSDDEGTIQAAKETIKRIGTSNINVAIFDGYPINKPHGLNVALQNAKNDLVVIFDAEDEPHKDIYNIINTVMLRDEVDIVQSGVQLMNYNSKWFSTLNVLEYFFWFKSSLHYFSRAGMIPLGGNTIFFKRDWINKVGGWDEDALTEDADIGIRLSVAGAKIRVVYDELHVTQEETPPDTASFIKQRTRWNQGFIQILLKGDWLHLPKVSQKILAVYVLTWPIIQALLFLYIPFSVWMIANIKMPVWVAILANFPLYVLIMHFVTYNIGLYEFIKGYGFRYSVFHPFKMLLVFFPYQIVLSIGAFRATWRTLKGNITWEKTLHINAHREARGIVPETNIRRVLARERV